MICMAFREWSVLPLFRRPWRLVIDLEKADFIIATERWHCGDEAPAVLIDEATRFGRPFAWTYAHRSDDAGVTAERPAPR
jgi:hypothetical protein